MADDNGRAYDDDDAADLRDDGPGDGSGTARRQAHAERERSHRIGTEPIRAEPADRGDRDGDGRRARPRRDDDGRPSKDKRRGDGDDEPREARAKDDHDHDDEKDDDEQEPKSKPWSTTKRVVIFGIIGLVLLVAIAAALLYWLHSRQYATTDDAFIDAHYEMVAPQVGGRVTKVLAEDNATVQPGETLLEIDPADYQVAIERAQANVASANGQVAQAKAQRDVAAAGVEQARADVDVAQSNLDNAQSELKRYDGLSKEAVSPQRLDDLRTAVRNATGQLTAAQKRASAQQAQVELAGSQIAAAEAGAKAAVAQRRQAELNLSYATVKATTGGRVAQRNVQAGDYVQPGQQLLILVPRDVYVTANYKETQLADIRPGQRVDLAVDAFPDQQFTGTVDSIQRGSGQIFSLLPPQNATGNYVKVVQRVPVKIRFDQTNGDAYDRLGPGMSVVPKVHIK